MADVRGPGRSLALAVLTCLCGTALFAACGSGDDGGVKVVVAVDVEAFRPERLSFTWFSPGGVPDQRRIPGGADTLPATGRGLASVFIKAADAGRRRVLVKGLRGPTDDVVSMAARYVDYSGSGVMDVELVLSGVLPDSDHDGIPDAIDDPAMGDGGAADGDTSDAPASDAPRRADVAGPSDGGPPPAAIDAMALPNAAACSSAAQCESKLCVDGVCCATACTESCLACNVEGARGRCTPVPGGTAAATDCPIQDAATCGRTGLCDGKGGCSVQPDGTRCGASVCTNNKFTPARLCDGKGACRAMNESTCGGYQCASAELCKSSCAGNQDCLAPNVCTNGQCSGPRPLGSACAAAGDCASGFCQQGVCCSTACAGGCLSCATTNNPGSCVPVPAGERPANACTDDGACGTDGACDGAGKCRVRPAGTTCAAASCTNGTETFARTCDGQGTCRAQVQVACSPYKCGATACKTSCTADSDCVGSSYCNGGACVPRQSNGQACSGASACVSGNCSGGVCCDSACTGVCQSCKVDGHLGACTVVPAGVRDDRCAVTSGCGTDGMCNGAGACRVRPAGTSCGSGGSCSGGVETSAPTCNGAGVCSSGASVPCDNYPCSGNACRTSCDTDNDCVRPAVCLDHVCGGLRAEYFDDIDFRDNRTMVVDASVDFDWGTDAPQPGFDGDTFSVRWTGRITPRFGERYTFTIATDDGVRLWVNNVKLVDRFVDGGAESTGSISLLAHQPVALQIEYFENEGTASAHLYWESPSQPKEIVPTSALSPP